MASLAGGIEGTAMGIFVARLARLEGKAGPSRLLLGTLGAMAFFAFDFAVGSCQCEARFGMVEVGGLLPVRSIVALLTFLAELPAMLVGVAGDALRAESEERSVEIFHPDGRLVGGRYM